MLTKIFNHFVAPLSFFLWIALVSGALALRRKRTATLLLFTSIGILWICSTPALSSYVVASLERRYLPMHIAESPSADAIVVLGGAVGAAEPPRLEVDLTEASDRVFHAARLYRARKASVVIVSGGGIYRAGVTTPEANSMAELLQELGVPASAIVIEPRGMNTFQNALNTKRLLASRGLDGVLLVTSAIHMRRALAVFHKAGLKAVPSPTDYSVVNRKDFTIRNFLPSVGALGGTTAALKEYLGFLVYRWRGWVN